VTHPLPTAQPIFAHSASTLRASEKSSSALIGSLPRAFQRAINEPCTLPLSPPKGGTKRDFAIFPVNFKCCRKTSAAKFRRVKTSSGNSVATSFLYLTVYRRIADDVPIYLKFALKVTHPRWKKNFDRLRLIVPQPRQLARKFNYPIIANRKSTTGFPASHRWTLYVTPKSPKGWLKTKFFLHLAVALHFFCLQVIVDISNLICGLNIGSPRLRMTKCLWNGRCHVTWPILYF